MGLIFIIEANNQFAEYLKSFLNENGYRVKISASGAEALMQLADFNPDLILINDNMSDITATSLVPRIRESNPSVPIIYIAEKNEPNKIRALFREGITDFVTKPIRDKVLLVRINIGIQFGGLCPDERRDSNLNVGRLTLSERDFCAYREDKKIKLSPQEFKLLKYLLQNRGRVLTRDLILTKVWGFNTDVKTRVVDVYVGYLRNKIDAGQKKKFIHTVRGFGYMIKDPD